MINPPSLHAYYQTLPQFCRDNPSVRNVLYAYEYHKPSLDIRDKELAMNYACSFLRPIEGRMLDVITEVASSNKIRLNMQNAKEMMNELKFYELDITELGEKTEDDLGDADENDLTEMLQRSVNDEDNEEEELNPMEMATRGLEQEARQKEREMILEDEMNISEFQVEPEVEQCMTDFYRKPYAEFDDVQAE